MGALVFFLNIIANLIIIFIIIVLAGAGMYLGIYFGERFTTWLAERRERKANEKLHQPSWKDVRFAEETVQ